MSDVSKKLSELSPEEKRALLAQLLRKKIDSAQSSQKQQVQEAYALSKGQRALWFLYRLAPASAAYNLLYAARLYADVINHAATIDIEALQRAVDTLLQRYPILTATYSMEGKEPVQHYNRQMRVPITVIDASYWSEDELRAQVNLEGNRPFQLETGPLLRLTIYRRSEREAVLALTIHHIVADLWSLDVLIGELGLLYAAYISGVQAPLLPVNAHFTDYLRWQETMLASAEGERHWRYWQQKLAGELPVLRLPTDKPRPVVQTYKGASHSFKISDEIARRLKQLAQNEHVTLFTLVLTAFTTLLYRYTDQDDVLLGTPTLGRNLAQHQKIIGYLANPVVLRANFAGNPTFRELLAQMRQAVIEALEHQDYPFPLLVEKLQPKRDPSYSPLIQTLFIWDKPRVQGDLASAIAQFAQGNGHGLNGLLQALPQFEPFAVGQQGAPFDLTLTIFELEDSLSADFRYNVDLFEPQTMARMEQHFLTLLESIVAQPTQHVQELPMLTEAERRMLLIDWNNTRRDFPAHSTIHQLIEAQVERTPDAVALIFEGQAISYAELNRRANQVAHTLQSLKVGPDTLVGVYMERSFEMVIALLAILKAGGAYVPLDPTYPAERIAYMMQDANLSIILTQSHLREQISQQGMHVLCLDQQELFAQQSVQNPTSSVGPENLIYMIYTSGSTGKPKGVMNIHRALVNRLYWMQEAYQLTPADRVMQKTPFGFDVAGWEFFWPLLTGASMVIARPRGHQDPAYMISLIEEQKVTTVHFVPSMLAMFLSQPDVARCTSLRRVICSGEALSFELQQRFFAAFPNPEVNLYNLYGPTEAAIDVSHWTCQRNSDKPVVPLGYPISNIQLYILNPALQPVPVGVAGELHIGGVGLARGYFNRPELTREKFIPDPFSAQPGARLYKTGDLARYRPDGAIEYLGRIDHQVKIRGVRIELGEVEATLAQYPPVKEVVVVAREDTPGNKRLVAYLVLKQAYAYQRVAIEEIRAYLKEHLPQEMIPAAFVFINALPVTPNGKVDRAALPRPEGVRPDLEAEYEAPRTPTEELLANIWAEVLGIDKVGIHDNFFDLGGASIQSLQVITKMGEAGIHLAPEQLFEHQTIAELAALIQSKAAVSPAPSTPALVQQDVMSQGEAKRTDVISQDVTNPVSMEKEQPEQSKGQAPQHMLIESMGVYLPPKIVSTKDVLAQCETPIRFPLEQLTGIKHRRMAGETEFAVDLAKKAVEHCLSNSKYNPQDIDLVICSSISRYNGPNAHVTFEPSTAAMLQQHFGFSNALVFDISNACTGMFTGMYIVDAFLKAGLIRRGLVVSGEYITHLTKTAQKEIEGYLDSRMACLTVGDAGAAVILEATADTSIGFHEFEMFTLGRYYDLCIAKATDKAHGGAIMYTDSVKVSAVNIQQAVAHAARVIARSGWPHDAFQHIVMHQTSKMTIYDAGREINSYFGREVCHEGNLINNIAERGNTATTTHTVALMDSILANRIKSHSNVVFGVTGSGVNIGTAIYTFDDLPDRLRRASTGTWRPEKVATEEKPLFLLPPNRRIRVESVGTMLLDAQVRRETLEMVRVAAERCLESSQYQRKDIDLLIYAGVYRDDFICEPAIASMVAGTLGINDTIESPDDPKTFSFDIFNGAVGFLDACYTSIAMIQSGKASRAMVVVSEVENNRETRPQVLRGLEETGSAVILDASPDGKTGFGNFVFKDGTAYLDAFDAYTVVENGKMVLHFEQDEQLESYYLRCIQSAVRELLSIEQLDMSQVKLVLPPQISSNFITKLGTMLEVERDKIVDVQAKRDLFTSSIPYTLQYAQQHGLARPGDIGLIITVGSGIQVGCATYYF